MFACPVCGAEELSVPPYEDWPPSPGVVLSPPYHRTLGGASFEICPNCGFEFGYDDDAGANGIGFSFEAWRTQWEQQGSARWSSRPRRDGA